MLIDRRFRAARHWSNDVLRQLAPMFTGEVANISGWKDQDKQGGIYRDYFTNASGYYVTNYSGTRGHQGTEKELFLDLTEDLPSKLYHRFDVAFNHTTLEHIFDVRKAFSNICRTSKDIVIVVVPFSQVQHETDSWKDYWRFTPSALRKLFKDNDIEVIYEAQSKLKHSAIYLLFVGSRDPQRWKDRMPKYQPIQEAGMWIGFSRLSGIYSALKRRILGNVEQ